MKKNPKQLSFWKKIRFKYKLSFLNENTLEESFSFRLSRLSFFWVILGFAVLLIVLTSVIIINTPIRNYLPGYLDSEVRKVIVENALRMDSLEQALATQTNYLNNISDILQGTSSVAVPQIDSITQKTTTTPNLEKSKVTASFVKAYEEEEKYNLNKTASAQGLPDNLIFYRPVKGIVSDHFDLRQKHYGVDIAANPKESVIATMNGTVIFTGFDANAGYVVHIQHPNGFVSIYKHNALLMKNQGDDIKAGEAIALAGNTGALSSGTHLHFELWFKGNPIDPEEFIVF
ncbi:MAG: M23 family metallopeptidase [Dysgonamonadaceae bacterium]|jgi:murein DD-endopeptidase MepM/ murein hydrolase activator NlpD|nr:M23 family metallopeptidase [Dysgonamonadaceae bacterium]